MPWWEYEPDKYRVPDLPDSATDRAGSAGVLIFLSWLVFAASLIVALFFRAWATALWIMGAGFAMLFIARLLMPKARPTLPHQ